MLHEDGHFVKETRLAEVPERPADKCYGSSLQPARVPGNRRIRPISFPQHQPADKDPGDMPPFSAPGKADDPALLLFKVIFLKHIIL